MSLSVQFAESSQPDKAGSSGQAGANTILEIEIERTGQSSVGVTTGFCTVCRIQPQPNRAGSSGRARASELNFTGRPATWPAAGSSCWDPRGKVHGRAGQLGKATGGRLSHRKRNQGKASHCSAQRTLVQVLSGLWSGAMRLFLAFWGLVCWEAFGR